MNSSVCLCVLDSRGEILFVSQGWKEGFCTNCTSHMRLLQPGVNLKEMQGIPLSDPAALIQLGARMILSREKEDFSFEFSDFSPCSKAKRTIRIELTPLGDLDRGCQVVIMDVTEMRKADQNGKFLSKLEKLTSEASLRLTTSTSAKIDDHIKTSLREVGQLVGADYAFVTKFYTDTEGGREFSSMTHFWHSDPPSGFEQAFQNLPLHENPYRDSFLANENVVLRQLEQLPDRFKFYRDMCAKLAVKSIACVPIFVDGVCYGYVGFVSTKQHHRWAEREVMVLRVLSEIFGAAFLRLRIEDALRERERSMLAFYRETEVPVSCYVYDPPIPIHLPLEKQFEMIVQGRIEDCNDVAARLLGFESREDLLGRVGREALGTPTESFAEVLRNFIRDGYRCSNARGEVILPDGTVRSWLNQAQGVVEEGKLVRTWVSARDITDSAGAEMSGERQGLYKNSSLTSAEIQEYIGSIEKIMRTERPYLDPNFNLSKLSKLVRVPDYQLSQVLNMGMKTSFYDLVNRYRVEHLIELLSKSGQDSTSILDLAYQVGFNSKSTFNTAFKKITGKTPSVFRAEIQEEGAEKRKEECESPEL